MDVRVFAAGAVLLFTVAADEPTNIALGKPAQASSVYTGSFGVEAGFVTDGSANSIWDSGSCFATQYNDVEPWLMVDLQGVYKIAGFRVLSRSDCCPENLSNFTVETFLENPVDFPAAVASLCVFYPGYPVPGELESVNCDTHVQGRYFRLRREASLSVENLALCEVEVYEVPEGSMCDQFTGTMNARMSHEKSIAAESPVECAEACTKMMCLAFNFRWAEIPECQIVSRISGQPENVLGWRFYERKWC